MANKGSYQGNPNQYGGQPPPYSSAPQTTVIVQQTRPVYVNKPSSGILGFVDRELNAMGRMVDREFNSIGKSIDGAIVQNTSTDVTNLFLTNNVVQLISRASGRALQIVTAPNGALVLDGCGALGSQVYNAVWTVINEGKNQIRLHNNNNYLAIVNGHTIIVHSPPGQPLGVETKFQLSQILGERFVALESMKERNHYIGVLNTGQLKPALATRREPHGQFAVSLVYSPYPAGCATSKP